MNKSLGEYGTFWFYMCWCIVGMFFVYFFLPETKGKSLDDIERMFANKKKQTLYATYAHPTIGVAEKADVFASAEAIPPTEERKSSHMNDGYDLEEEENNNGEVVPTPL